MTLYQSKYRIESARLKGWDYASTAWYFVTICTLNRQAYFGKVTAAQVSLSRAGNIAQSHWSAIPSHYNGEIQIDDFVVMPNHVHGIISIAAVMKHKSAGIAPESRSLGAAIRSFKAGVSRECRRDNIEFQWQSRFYESIIRGPRSLAAIREYIFMNPANWVGDEFFIET